MNEGVRSRGSSNPMRPDPLKTLRREVDPGRGRGPGTPVKSRFVLRKSYLQKGSNSRLVVPGRTSKERVSTIFGSDREKREGGVIPTRLKEV